MSLGKHTTIVERVISTRLVAYALAEGMKISVYDGGRWSVSQSTNCQKIVDALATSDQDRLRFYNSSNEIVGWVDLAWGSEEDLISDYSDNEEMRRLCDDVLGQPLSVY